MTTRTDAAVCLELPFPPKQLSPNARVGWREKAKVTAQYREDCGWLAKNAWLTVGLVAPPVRATVTFVVPDRRKRDLDNLLAMLKPAWDGLVDAGVLEGDDSERFSVGETNVLLHHDDVWPYRPCVIVELTGAL